MVCCASTGICQSPEGNSSSLLTVTLMAFCNRVICIWLAATSFDIVWLSCWYSASSASYFCCDASYFCCETQPASNSMAMNVIVVYWGNLHLDIVQSPFAGKFKQPFFLIYLYNSWFQV